MWPWTNERSFHWHFPMNETELQLSLYGTCLINQIIDVECQECCREHSEHWINYAIIIYLALNPSNLRHSLIRITIQYSINQVGEHDGISWTAVCYSLPFQAVVWLCSYVLRWLRSLSVNYEQLKISLYVQANKTVCNDVMSAARKGGLLGQGWNKLSFIAIAKEDPQGGLWFSDLNSWKIMQRGPVDKGAYFGLHYRRRTLRAANLTFIVSIKHFFWFCQRWQQHHVRLGVFLQAACLYNKYLR